MTDIEKFEKAVLNAYEKMCAGKAHLTPYTNHVKDAASELLALAREGYVRREEKWYEVETTAKNEFLRGRKECAEEYESLPKIRGWWVARDENGDLWAFEMRPRRTEHSWWDRDYTRLYLDKDDFPEITWKSEPVEVELLIRMVCHAK